MWPSIWAAEGAALLPSVPDDFAVTLVAQEPLVRNPCAMAFDGRGRLFVGQGPQYRNPKPATPGDTVELLIDSDGDGVFDKAKTFAKGLNNVQGLAWRGRDLYIANSPDLTICRDTDGDDVADEYVRVYTDLGNIEHGLHGLHFGPDGKLYMSKGNSKGINKDAAHTAPKAFRELFDIPSLPGAPDLPSPRTFTPETYRKTYHDPADDWGRMGGTLRADPDGSKLEIVSRGYRNPFDVAFDAEFNWLGTDNDQTEGDRIFSPFFGAHFGWAHTWSPDWTGKDHLPTVPISGPVFTGSGTGIVYMDTPGWPASFRGVWFINDFLKRTTYVYRPTWDGALMQPKGGKWEPFARAGAALYQPIDIRVGPDGALYVTGWGNSLGLVSKGGQQQNEGRIFRIAPRALPKPAARPAAPLAQRSVAELISDLGVEVASWRTHAAEELVRRSAKADLIAALRKGGLSTAQETWLLWTLGRLEPASREHTQWFADVGQKISPNARVQSMRIAAHRLREWQRGPLPAFVTAALDDPEPRVRFTAVQSIMQARQTALADRLWLLAVRETDRVTYYAIWNALREIAPAATLKTKLSDEHPGVRRAALLALFELGALDTAAVQPLVKDRDPATANLAAQWLAKRSGNSLLVVEPPAGSEFTGELRVAITPGIKPSAVSFTTDGSEPSPNTRKSTARINIKDTTTIKAALFVDGKKVGNTVEATYRKRATSAAPAITLTPPAEPTTLAQVKALLPTAKADRGHAIFTAAGCFACHRIGQEGGAFGPELTDVGARGNPEHLIRSILEPNAAITEGFTLLSVTTQDGKSAAGRLHEESGAVLTLMAPDGSLNRIQRSEITTRESLHQSPMPPYDRVLSAPDLAALIAWLGEQK